jgi:hypothetical protein
VKRIALLFAVAVLLTGAREETPVLIPDVSQREVDIHYSFTGAELLLFGAILYPGGKVPDGRTDVAVVLKGPPQSILVREKQKLAAVVWANAGSTRFRSAPAFYAIAASRPLSQLIDARTAAILAAFISHRLVGPIQSMRTGSRRVSSISGRAVDCSPHNRKPSKLPKAFSIVRPCLSRHASPMGAIPPKPS